MALDQTEQERKIFVQGWDAWKDGKYKSENPYDEDSKYNRVWLDGWRMAEEIEGLPIHESN